MSLLFTLSTGTRHVQNLQLDTGRRYCLQSRQCLYYLHSTRHVHIYNSTQADDNIQNKDNVSSIYNQDNSTRAELYDLHSRQELDMYTFTTQDRFTLSTGTRHVQNLQHDTGRRYCSQSRQCLYYLHSTRHVHIYNSTQVDDNIQNEDNVSSIYNQDNSTRAQLYYLHSRQELNMYTFTTQDRFTLSTGTRHVQNLQLDTGRRYCSQSRQCLYYLHSIQELDTFKIYNSTQVDHTVQNKDNVCSIYTQDNSTHARLYYLHTRQELDTCTTATRHK